MLKTLTISDAEGNIELEAKGELIIAAVSSGDEVRSILNGEGNSISVAQVIASLQELVNQIESDNPEIKVLAELSAIGMVTHRVDRNFEKEPEEQ